MHDWPCLWIMQSVTTEKSNEEQNMKKLRDMTSVVETAASSDEGVGDALRENICSLNHPCAENGLGSDEFLQWNDRKRKDNVEPKEGSDGKMYPRWHDPDHNWSHQKARQNFVRAKDLGRHFWDNYDKFTTVHVVRTSDNNKQPLLEQTKALSPKKYTQCRYRLLNRLDEDYAAISVKAPKYPTIDGERTVRSHNHEIYYLTGHIEPESFKILREKHMDTVQGATDCHISVEHQNSGERPAPCDKNGLDSERGTTTALPHELAENLPMMNVSQDALNLYDELCLKWCATLSGGKDGSHDTKGKPYWSELGEAKSIADKMKEERNYGEDANKSKEEQESALIEEYVADGVSNNNLSLRLNVEQDADKLDGKVNIDHIVEKLEGMKSWKRVDGSRALTFAKG